MTTLLALDAVSTGYAGGPVVLDGVDLAVHRGSFTGVVGPSGSGKTTVLRTLLGTVAPTSGAVRRSEGVRIGYVPQTETVDWNFPVTVADVVLMARRGPWWRPWTAGGDRDAAEEVLASLGLGGLGHRHIRHLSGGQQQRVFIARALFGRADVLLLDEPTAGVDVHTRHDVLHLLGDLHRAGQTILLTTHDLNGIAAHLPHLVCLNRRVIAAGPPADVLRPEVLEATYGARLDVLEHEGLRVVVDAAAHPLRRVM